MTELIIAVILFLAAVSLLSSGQIVWGLIGLGISISLLAPEFFALFFAATENLLSGQGALLVAIASLGACLFAVKKMLTL